MPWPTEVRNSDDQLYACAACGSTACEIECWVDVNTNEVLDGCGSGDTIWCPNCETHDTTLVLIKRDAEKTEKKGGL